jgi:hypothetical protein
VAQDYYFEVTLVKETKSFFGGHGGHNNIVRRLQEQIAGVQYSQIQTD